MTRTEYMAVKKQNQEQSPVEEKPDLEGTQKELDAANAKIAALEAKLKAAGIS